MNSITNSDGFRPKLNIGAFFGESNDFEPTIQHYDKTKVGYGLWDFRIKHPKEKGLPPIGIFSGVYRNGFIAFLNHYGFCKRYRQDGSYFFLRCLNNIIEKIEPITISDFIVKHLEEKGEEISFDLDVDGNRVTFVASLLLQQETIKKQCHGLFNEKFLELLPTFDKKILRDTNEECFKLFRNAICKITANGFASLDYQDLQDKCVWKNHIIDFDLTYTNDFKKSHFYKFVYNVSNAEVDMERHRAFKTSIGYLLHNYNSAEKGQCIICYDEVITDISRPEGGTGKGVFAKALSCMSDLVKIDGKKFDENDRFCFQRVTESTQIVFFDDVKTKLGFDRFNSILTDGWNIEKKNRDEFPISPQDSPKVLMSANSILECEGSTRKRRQHILEFSDYYSKNIVKGNEEPIKTIHGCVFFSSDWDQNELQMFYSFLLKCIWDFMQDGLITYEPKNLKSNRLRQITNDDFAEWVGRENFEVNKAYETKPFYEEFKNIYYPDEIFSQRKFTSYLKKFASLNEWRFNPPKPSGGITYFCFNT